MKLMLNGEEREVADGRTLAEILQSWDFDPSRIAVEVNLQIVHRTQHATCQPQDGDRLEIVTFVQAEDDRDVGRHSRRYRDERAVLTMIVCSWASMSFAAV